LQRLWVGRGRLEESTASLRVNRRDAHMRATMALGLLGGPEDSSMTLDNTHIARPMRGVSGREEVRGWELLRGAPGHRNGGAPRRPGIHRPGCGEQFCEPRQTGRCSSGSHPTLCSRVRIEAAASRSVLRFARRHVQARAFLSVSQKLAADC
jgi:hypothetical protein